MFVPLRILLGWVLCLVFGAVQAQGRFVVLPPQFESAELRDTARELQDSGALQEMAKSLNEMLALPRNVNMRFEECGEANAYYDSESYLISLCIELMDDMAQTLAPQFEEEDLGDALAGAFVTVLLHEVGHALVHVLELPITGREEDAVDQLAAWVLIEGDDADSVRGGAASYYIEDDESAEDDFADTHSLNRQRYYNLMCWVYGSAPDDNADLLDEAWGLPEERAEGCTDEYTQLDRSWSRLLKGHLRSAAAAPPPRNPPPIRAPNPAPIQTEVQVERPPASGGGRPSSTTAQSGSAPITGVAKKRDE